MTQSKKPAKKATAADTKTAVAKPMKAKPASASAKTASDHGLAVWPD